MRHLPREEAAAIFRRTYWLRPGLDRVAMRAPTVAAELFDTGVNMGAETAVGFLQRALNALNRGARDYPDVPGSGRVDPRRKRRWTASCGRVAPRARRCC
jgi:lysozyme family protein